MSGGRVQRIEPARGGGEEDPPADQRRLAGVAARIGERPLDLQLADVGGLQTRIGLVAGVGQVAAPAVPVRLARMDRRRAALAHIDVGLRWRGGQGADPRRRAAGEIGGDRGDVLRPHALGHRLHRAGGEDGDDVVGGVGLQIGLGRRASAALDVMALGAAIAIQVAAQEYGLFAGRRRRSPRRCRGIRGVRPDQAHRAHQGRKSHDARQRHRRPSQHPTLGHSRSPPRSQKAGASAS